MLRGFVTCGGMQAAFSMAFLQYVCPTPIIIFAIFVSFAALWSMAKPPFKNPFLQTLARGSQPPTHSLALLPSLPLVSSPSTLCSTQCPSSDPHRPGVHHLCTIQYHCPPLGPTANLTG